MMKFEYRKYDIVSNLWMLNILWSRMLFEFVERVECVEGHPIIPLSRKIFYILIPVC